MHAPRSPVSVRTDETARRSLPSRGLERPTRCPLSTAPSPRWLAGRAGDCSCRSATELGYADPAALKAAGDKRPTSCSCAELARWRPADAVLSEEDASRLDDRARRLSRRARLDHRPARRHPRVRRGGPRRLGGARRALAADAPPELAGRGRGGAAGAAPDRRAPDQPPAVPAAPQSRQPRRRDPARGQPHPAAGVRDRAGRRIGAELVPMGSAGAKIAAVVAGDGRRLRARRRPVRVGLRGAGRCRRSPRACTLPGSTAPRCATTEPTRCCRTCWSAARIWPIGCLQALATHLARRRSFGH